MTVPTNTPAPEPVDAVSRLKTIDDAVDDAVSRLSLVDDALSRLRTADELAEHYGICRASVYNWLHRGMPSVQLGRSRRFRLPEVDAWLAEADTRKVAS